MEYTITYKFLIMSRRLVLLKHPNCLFLRWRIAPLRKELWAMGTTSGVDPGWSLRLENGWCIFSGWSRSFCKNRIESFQNQRETVFSLLFFFPGIYRMCLVVSHSKMFCLWMSLPETGPKGQYFGMRRSHQWCMGFLHWKWRFEGHNKVMALNTYKWAYSDIPNLSYRSYMSICNC